MFVGNTPPATCRYGWRKASNLHKTLLFAGLVKTTGWSRQRRLKVAHARRRTWIGKPALMGVFTKFEPQTGSAGAYCGHHRHRSQPLQGIKKPGTVRLSADHAPKVQALCDSHLGRTLSRLAAHRRPEHPECGLASWCASQADTARHKARTVKRCDGLPGK
jgi:hypothetical protein